MAVLLNGRDLALSLRAELRFKVHDLKVIPRLGVLLVGDDPASHLYVALKEQAANEVGIEVEKVLLPKNSTTQEVIGQIQIFNQRPEVHGILVQLPLPPQINEREAMAALDPTKDADGFHPQNLQRLLNNTVAIVPGVSAGIMKLIELAHEPLVKKQACLVVNSQEFALPLKKLLEDNGAAVSISHMVEPEALRHADIVIVALGQPGIIKSEFIKDGAIIIDVGTTKIGGRVVGDVEAAGFSDRQVYLTPVPGGVGPMTVVMLLWNVYNLAKSLA